MLTTGHPIKRGRGSSGPRDLDESAGTWGEDSLEDSAQSLRQQLKRRGAASAGREAGTEPATSASQAAPGLTPLPGVGVPPSADIHSAIGAVAEAARSGLEEEEEGPKGPTLPGHSFAWTLAGQEEGAAAAVVHPWAPAVEPTQGLHSSESSGPVAVTSTVESYFSSSEEPVRA